MKYKLLIPFLMLFLCGCTSEEVHHRSYMRGAAISGIEEKTVAVSFYDEESETVSSKGESFDKIISEIELDNGKSVFTGHTEIIVLGECDYTNTLQFILEEWKVSPSCLIMYGGADSEEIITKSDSEKLANIIRTAVKQNIVPQNDIITVLSSLLQHGTAEIPSINAYGKLDKTTISDINK